MHSLLRRTAVTLSLVLAAAAAHADELQDISRMMRQGQLPQSLERVDKLLTGKPRDAQGRFLKGLILTEMNRPAEAIQVFAKLSEDYPELPEPYNNLAVLYASQGQYERARTALESSIRTHPSYATARMRTWAISTPSWPARPMTKRCNWTPPIPVPRPSWP